MNVDIVWPAPGSIGPGRNSSRLVLAHELGHHIFFQMMVTRSPNPALYAQHLTAIFQSTIAVGFGPITAGNLFFQPRAVNEGIAEVFTEQLAGGGNRLGILGLGIFVGDRDGGDEMYCDVTDPLGCFEFNYTGAATELVLFGPGNDREVNLGASRISTTIHDMIDDSVGDVSHNGHVWHETTGGCPATIMSCPLAAPLVPVPDPSAGFGEEVVPLPFPFILLGLQLWLSDPLESSILTTDALMHGMTRSMRLAGLPDAAICAMYALHTPTGMCPPFWMAP